MADDPPPIIRRQSSSPEISEEMADDPPLTEEKKVGGDPGSSTKSLGKKIEHQVNKLLGRGDKGKAAVVQNEGPAGSVLPERLVGRFSRPSSPPPKKSFLYPWSRKDKASSSDIAKQETAEFEPELYRGRFKVPLEKDSSVLKGKGVRPLRQWKPGTKVFDDADDDFNTEEPNLIGPKRYFRGNTALWKAKGHLTAENNAVHGNKVISEGSIAAAKELVPIWVAKYETGANLIPLNLQRLRDQYSFCRRIRGDGDSFYKAFLLAYLEHILESRDVTEVARMQETVKKCKLTLNDFSDELKYDLNNDTIEKILEDLNNTIQEVDKSLSPLDLLIKFKNPKVYDIVVKFLRFVTAAEIRKRSDYFVPRLGTSEEDAKKFCRNSVLPMGVEVSEHHIRALCSALGVPIRVYYLDQPSISNGRVPSRIYTSLPSPTAYLRKIPPQESGDIQPRITLAFTPGFYSILYPKS